MQDTRFGVIILNYIGWEETINCLESFMKFSSPYNVRFAIVENGSPNESCTKLQEYFQGNEQVDVIVLEQNTGFAKGNNAGYKHLFNMFDPDYYIFSNSDILIKDDIFRWIVAKYDETNFTLLGPDIFAVKMHKHQNPLSRYTENKLLLRGQIIRKRIDILISYILLKLGATFDIHSKDFSENEIIQDTTKYFENVPLHGSLIIFHKSFFNYYNEPFDPDTFLYMEERLLSLRCWKHNLKTVVSYDFSVIHLQAASTDKMDKSVYQKRINRMKNEIHSINII